MDSDDRSDIVTVPAEPAEVAGVEEPGVDGELSEDAAPHELHHHVLLLHPPRVVPRVVPFLEQQRRFVAGSDEVEARVDWVQWRGWIAVEGICAHL